MNPKQGTGCPGYLLPRKKLLLSLWSSLLLSPTTERMGMGICLGSLDRKCYCTQALLLQLKAAGAALHLILSGLDLAGFSGTRSAGFNRTARTGPDQRITPDTAELPFAVGRNWHRDPNLDSRQRGEILQQSSLDGMSSSKPSHPGSEICGRKGRMTCKTQSGGWLQGNISRHNRDCDRCTRCAQGKWTQKSHL